MNTRAINFKLAVGVAEYADPPQVILGLEVIPMQYRFLNKFKNNVPNATCEIRTLWESAAMEIGLSQGAICKLSGKRGIKITKKCWRKL